MGRSTKIKRALERIEELERERRKVRQEMHRELVGGAVRPFKSLHQRSAAARARVDQKMAMIDPKYCALVDRLVVAFPDDLIVSGYGLFMHLMQHIDFKDCDLAMHVLGYVLYVLKELIRRIHAGLKEHAELYQLDYYFSVLEDRKEDVVREIMKK